MSKDKTTGLAKLKGMPVKEATDIRPEKIQGEKPNIKLLKDGQHEKNTFAKRGLS